MITIILLIFFSILILIMGLLEIPLPFIKYPAIKKSKKIKIHQSPIKNKGVAATKNTENEKAHFRFIKNHIRNYELSK